MRVHARPRPLPLLLGLVLALATTSIALAHGGETAIELDPDTVVAGEPVTVAGEDFESKAKVDLVLVGAGMRVDLGSVTADDEGHFTVKPEVPAATTAGPYVIEADGPSGDPLASAPLTVTAAASPSTVPSGSPAPSADASPASSSPSSASSAAPSEPAASPSGPTASPSPLDDPGTTPTSSSDGMLLLAVVAIAVVAGVGGGIVLARRGRPSV
jgi:hypothetical protein